MCMCKPALTAFTIKLCHFGGYLHSDTPDPHPHLKEKKTKNLSEHIVQISLS